ncbi:Transcriptional regulator [Caenorhabditis elegans]|nr:Transcriptional regulator [Caenorhabditis elegans]CCD31148.1 Transcriptional regulator [Caenorhabditis elegans]|eukprot:NP_001254425.1 Uncharacterized protein CELE_Y54G11A.14 [Caenorhabditis elegans]
MGAALGNVAVVLAALNDQELMKRVKDKLSGKGHKMIWRIRNHLGV